MIDYNYYNQSVCVFKEDGGHMFKLDPDCHEAGVYWDGSVEHHYNGQGGDNIIIPMQLFLKYRDNMGLLRVISIKEDFTEMWQKISKKRLSAIQKTMPKEFLISFDGVSGRAQVLPSTMTEWKQKALNVYNNNTAEED